MKLFCFLSVIALTLAVLAVEVTLPTPSHEETRRIADLLERYKVQCKALSSEDRKSLDEAIAKVKSASRTDSRIAVDEGSFLKDIALFKESRAYGFLDATERTRLQELVTWVKEQEAGQHRNPPSFLQTDRGELKRKDAISLPKGLKRGDIVFRREESFLSHHFVEASSRERRFSHVGIVVDSGNDTRVVTVGDGGVSIGAVGAEGWSAFVVSAVDCAVYRFKGGEDVGERIAQAAEKRIGIPFDPAFDLKTKDRLYCSELVRDAVNEAVGKAVIGTTKKGTFEYVAIDDCYRSGWIKVFDVKDGK